MDAHWTEKDRLLSIETPLGADKLLLRSFTGHEQISRLFRFELDLLSEDTNIDFDKIVGQNVTFSIKQFDATKQRHFNGYVSRFAQLPNEERLSHYKAEVVPWPWFLTRTADCRIFQNLSVPDIVQKVFKQFGFQDFELQLQGDYDAWEYCVQYRETALNFVMRLLEEEGIFFFFRHEKTKHTLVLGDSPSAHKPCPDQSKARYERALGQFSQRVEDGVFEWRIEQEMRTGKYAQTDYNFETPSTSLLASVDSQINQGGNHRFETFDYPGEYEKRNQGDEWAKVRMEEEEAVHAVVTGESDIRTFVSGFKFELSQHDRRDQNGTYLLTSVVHSGEQGGLYSGAGSGDAKYSNRFTAIPFAVRFRPLRLTPKPAVRGLQTAVVVGPDGEEIYTDKYGRVKVKFYWDRAPQANEKSSCWIRVSHLWAGKNWGAISIPRIGQEVIVDFLEGDPDRPIITGRVYNAIEMPPYTLPGEQTKTTFKTNSSKGGGGFNELRFEDKKDSEQIFLHGQKDQDIRIENDRREWIGEDRSLIVQRDKIEQIQRDSHSDITRDRIVHFGRDHHLKIDGKEAISISGAQSVQVTGSVTRQSSADVSESATGNIYITGMNVVVEGMTGLTINCGASFVTCSPAGVMISGPLVTINSGGAALSGTAGSPVSPNAP
ncbi:MAG: type VI secretion system tip protein VgrG, partial [Bryobacteraceae bacterium]